MSWAEALKAYAASYTSKPSSSNSSSVASSYSGTSTSPFSHPTSDAAELLRQERSVTQELRLIYEKEAKQREEQQATKRTSKPVEQKQDDIPRFYIKRATSPPPAEPDAPTEGADGEQIPAVPPVTSLAYQLRREARTRYLESRAEQLLDDRELGILWETIQIHSVDTNTSTGAPVTIPTASSTSTTSTSSTTGNTSTTTTSTTSIFDIEKRLNYDNFILISQSLPGPKANRYFKPSTFLSFPQDRHGRISSRALWRYITKKIQLTRLRISLTCYDDIGYGYLREQDLENYVYDQLGSLPPLQSLERDFYPYYVFTAVRKFIFFLDPHRRGKLRIKTIVESAVMLEFDALRYPHGHHQGTKKNSWFSANHTQEVYAIYLGLDSNQNGMLSREEFKAYNGGHLTNIFIDGLFSEYRMYPSSSSHGEDGQELEHSSSMDGDSALLRSSMGGEARNELEMDYKTFLDFVLAMEYKTTPASIAYFFKILDIQHQGFLDSFTITYWFRAVSDKMREMNPGAFVDISDVVANEIFDMVCPAEDGKITLADLISSRCGHTVISILIDVNGFFRYDNRETLMHEEEEN